MESSLGHGDNSCDNGRTCAYTRAYRVCQAANMPSFGKNLGCRPAFLADIYRDQALINEKL